jgi:hypothetical protein
MTKPGCSPSAGNAQLFFRCATTNAIAMEPTEASSVATIESADSIATRRSVSSISSTVLERSSSRTWASRDQLLDLVAHDGRRGVAASACA